MTQTAAEKIDQFVMKTYGRSPVTFVRGKGCKLWDDQGKEYLDFLAGIAVCNLGHAHPGVTEAVCQQAAKLTHVCNLYYTEPQAEVAELLVKNSFADRVFFCNSGAEANEGAIKASRLWGKKYLNGAHTVITMAGSFHGRTLATLSATGQEKIQKGFDPLVPRFKQVTFGDLDALAAALDKDVCAVLLEPILGEGGVLTPPAGYLSGVRELCAAKKIMLIFDEIQTGLGRTGRLFAHEHFGVTPDVMTLAKGLANGLPAGAVVVRQEVADLFAPGTHATTFGAGPVIMAAAAVVLKTLVSKGFLEKVRESGAYFREKLEGLVQAYPDKCETVRGMGLMQGLVLKGAGAGLIGELLSRGFVVNCTQEKILRFVPPLIVQKAEIDALIQTLGGILENWNFA
jgi:predicted acetylornithine/succinylornithine family transaminase